MIPFVSPSIGDEEIASVLSVLKSKWLVHGKCVDQFEREFADYIGSKYCVAVMNGTCGLHLSMLATGIQPGDEVVTTPLTFIATANTILFAGGVPTFSDVRQDTYNIDPEDIQTLISKKTRAIMPVHLYGNPAEMCHINDIAEDHDLIVIEDAAQGHGAYINKKHVGTFGDVGVFSFYATKNMITGEGGAVVTDDPEIAQKLKSLRNHGRDDQTGYLHKLVGHNFRMTDIAGAIGLVQLKKLDGFLKKRKSNMSYLNDIIDETDGIRGQRVLAGHEHGAYILAPLIEKNLTQEQVIDELRQLNIASRTNYSTLIPDQPSLSNSQFFPYGSCIEYPNYPNRPTPHAKFISERHFEIPIIPSLSQDELEYIGNSIRSIFR